MNRGWLLFALCRFQGALHDFEQEQHLKPDDPHIHYCKGRVFWDTWQYEEALQAHEQAIALDPRFARAYLARATTLSYLGRGAEARQVSAFYQQLIDAAERLTE